jgi:hypothetical protein
VLIYLVCPLLGWLDINILIGLYFSHVIFFLFVQNTIVIMPKKISNLIMLGNILEYV